MCKTKEKNLQKKQTKIAKPAKAKTHKQTQKKWLKQAQHRAKREKKSKQMLNY